MLTTLTQHTMLANMVNDEDQNQRRIVGIILAEIGRQRLARRFDIAEVLDDLVTRIEQAQPAHMVDLG